MRRTLTLLASTLVLLGVTTACEPDPGPTGLYRGIQPGITPVVTPKNAGVLWGGAPVIDPNYGGTIYEGTPIEMQDPRPAAVNGRQPLRYWKADPDNGLTDRPAIIWLHGGGFAKGIESMYGLANSAGKEYAQRGYVSFSLEYRMDTTVMAPTTTSLCQWVQDNVDPEDPVWVDRKETCANNITAAQRDVLAFVRYLKANASTLGIDPGKIAVAGFSAGAVTASNAAFQWDDVGPVAYFPGDDKSPLDSRPNAAIGASGCTFNFDSPTGAPDTVDALDAPTSFIASELDPAVNYQCSVLSTQAARDAGLVAELTSYCGQAGHANNLYEQHKAETDEQWTTFLVRQLAIYSGTREPTAAPFCP